MLAKINMARTSKGDSAIAGTFGLDVDELSDYRYHIDGTSRKVYAFDDIYHVIHIPMVLVDMEHPS